MDLLQNYMSSGDEADDNPSMSVQEPPTQGSSAESGLNSRDAKKAKKKKKKAFRKLIEKPAIQDMFKCKYCPVILNRRSISRHIKTRVIHELSL